MICKACKRKYLELLYFCQVQNNAIKNDEPIRTTIQEFATTGI